MLSALIALALAAQGPALTPIHSESIGDDVPMASAPLVFDRTSKSSSSVVYDGRANPYLTKLREMYDLDRIAAGPGGDLGKLNRLTLWTHKQWAHNGGNEPSREDALTILAEVKDGKQYRCVEYSTVLAAAANAIGIPARSLNIKTADVETRAGGAGHVVVEAYVRDLHKWVMLDGQFGVMPMRGKTPLNAVEFQAAIARKDPRLNLGPDAQTSLPDYLDFVRAYLFYFDVSLHPHHDEAGSLQPGNVMLTPVGAKEPAVFQRRFPIRNMSFTTSTRDFYAAPGIR